MSQSWRRPSSLLNTRRSHSTADVQTHLVTQVMRSRHCRSEELWPSANRLGADLDCSRFGLRASAFGLRLSGFGQLARLPLATRLAGRSNRCRDLLRSNWLLRTRLGPELLAARDCGRIQRACQRVGVGPPATLRRTFAGRVALEPVVVAAATQPRLSAGSLWAVPFESAAALARAPAKPFGRDWPLASPT